MNIMGSTQFLATIRVLSSIRNNCEKQANEKP